MGTRQRRCALSVLALACIALGTGAVRAESQPPLACGSRAAFESELLKRLGTDTAIDTVQVSIAQTSTGFHLRVQVGSEVRELDDASCAELFRASLVVTAAMLLHEEQDTPVTAPAPARERQLGPREYPRVGLALGAGLNLGTLPNPVPAVELETKLHWQALGVALNLRYLSPTQKLHASDEGAHFRAWSAGVTGIFRPSRFWETRLGVAAQRLSGEGNQAIARPRKASTWAAGPTLGLAFTPVQSHALWAGLGAEGQFNALRGHFEILNYSGRLSTDPFRAYSVPWLAATAFVRLGLVW